MIAVKTNSRYLRWTLLYSLEDIKAKVFEILVNFQELNSSKKNLKYFKENLYIQFLEKRLMEHQRSSSSRNCYKIIFCDIYSNSQNNAWRITWKNEQGKFVNHFQSSAGFFFCKLRWTCPINIPVQVVRILS